MRLGAELLALLVLLAAAPASAQSAPEAYEAVSVSRVSFEAAMPGLVLSRSDGHGGWTPLGVPGALVLPPGRLDLALSYENHAPVRVPISLEVPDGATLVGHYESRQGWREFGVGVLLGSAVLVLVGVAIAIGGFLASTTDVGIGALVAAGSLGVVGGATGLTLATLDDLATIDVL